MPIGHLAALTTFRSKVQTLKMPAAMEIAAGIFVTGMSQSIHEIACAK